MRGGLWDLFLVPTMAGVCSTWSLAFSTSRCHSCEAYERSERCSCSSGIYTMLLCVESNGGGGGRNCADSDHFFSTLLKQDPFIYKNTC